MKAIRRNFERRMREVTVYGLVPYDARPIVSTDPVKLAHLRIDMLEKTILELLEEIERNRDDGK
jgi:hypothetical protein